ncbi:MAG TPA: hypothetical protein PK987_04085, partial [Ferruginibacter sp.]|nr:hypothetical protein [Ferruginibacter sp.]
KLVSENEISVELCINTGHKIFEGHFPNQPVVPGVCMVQMIKEMVEDVLDIKTKLTEAAELKFLSVIDPLQNNLINATIKYMNGEDRKININASFFKNELIHFKCKLCLQKSDN